MSATDIFNPPLTTPPPGVEANFEHPESKKPAMIAAYSVIAPITVLFVYLRIHAKAIVMREFDASDWFCVLGFISLVAYSYTIYDLAVIPGVGQHDYELHFSDFTTEYLGNLLASGVLLGVTLLFIKLSLLCFVLRLFRVNRWARYATIAGITLHALVYVVYIFLSLYLTLPRPGQTILEAISTPLFQKFVAVSSFQAVWDAVEDFLILGVSIPIIMTLNTTLARRLQASSIFVVGLVVTGFTIALAYFRINSNNPDTNWNYPTLFILTYYEMCTATICACLPCLPILGKSTIIQRVMDSRIFSTLRSFSISRSQLSNRGDSYNNIDKPNSSTTNFAQGDSNKSVTVVQTFDVEHSYELQPKTSTGFGSESSNRQPRV